MVGVEKQADRVPPIVTGCDLTFTEMAAVLASMFNIASHKFTAFNSRIGHFNRLGLREQGTRGVTTHHSREDCLRYVMAVQFTVLGIPPAKAIKTINEYWSVMAEGFDQASKGQESVLILELQALTDDLGDDTDERPRKAWLTTAAELPSVLARMGTAHILRLAPTLRAFSKTCAELGVGTAPVKPAPKLRVIYNDTARKIDAFVAASAPTEVDQSEPVSPPERPSLRDDLLHGAKAAADYTGLSTRQIYHMVYNGQIPFTQKGRAIFFRKSQLDEAFR